MTKPTDTPFIPRAGLEMKRRTLIPVLKPTTIGLVSCSASKLDRAAPAAELYTSQLFRKSLTWARERCEMVYILSAFHGLLDLESVIAPYDRRLGGKRERTAWANRIADSLRARHGLHLEISILAGAEYAEPIRCALFPFKSIAIAQPLEGKQIGQRLSWLSSNIVTEWRA